MYRVDPRYTSKLCPIHHVEIEYGKDRHGVCKVGGEIWHRDVVAVYNILSCLGDGSTAPSLGEGKLNLYVSPVPLWSNATHDPVATADDLRGEVEVPRGNEVRDIREYHKSS